MTAPSGLPVYLDSASSAPLDERVIARMNEAMRAPELSGNASAEGHLYGRVAASSIAAARAQVSALIGGDPEGLIWTSGATESDNLALLGTARFREMHGRHIVTTAIEHSAVLGPARKLQEQGFAVTFLEPDSQGRIAPRDVAAALRDDTILVSVMHANNETGVIQDIGAIGSVCRTSNALFHTDAAQSAGRVPLNVDSMGIDLVSLSAHKLHGPKGIGALWMNRERISRIEPLMLGGGHERGIRPGTLPTHQIIGMGEAFAIALREMDADVARITALREALWNGIADLPGLVRFSADAETLCSIISIGVEGVEGESLQLALRGLAVTSGSACNSATDEASYVLRALGADDQLAQSTIRFSPGRQTTADDIAAAVAQIRAGVGHLRSIAGTEQG